MSAWHVTKVNLLGALCEVPAAPSVALVKNTAPPQRIVYSVSDER